MEEHGGSYDPTAALHAAHESAAVLVHTGRASRDPEVAARLTALVEQIGLDAVAELWSERPAHSLPGALWRLYALREWVRRSPEQASREYSAGVRFASAEHAVAGAADPLGPQQIDEVVEQILRGVFTGDLDVALERAAAFCRLVAAGRAEHEEPDLDSNESHPSQPTTTESAARMLEMAGDLAVCARLWRSGDLH